MRRLVSTAVIAGLTLASGCARERRLFDVVIEVIEAESLVGVLDEADVLVLHEVIPDVGEGNGGDGLEQTITLALDPQATTATFTVTVARDDPAGLQRLGFGRSLPVSLPVEGSTITASLLLAPANAPAALTALPPRGGPDTCVTDDGLGAVFIAGGTLSQQGAYVISGVEVTSIAGAAYPAGVGSVGCGARGGLLAVVGGCGVVDDSAVFVIATNGNRDAFATTAIGEPCGATASPRRDDSVWLLDGDFSLHRVTRTTTIDLGTIDATDRTGFEVNKDDAAVILADGTLFYAGDVLSELGPHLALGRRGEEVLVLDGDGLVSVVENATTRALFDGVAFDDVRSFVVLGDDTFVGLRRGGATLDVRFPDGTTRSVATSAPGSTRIAALPDDVVVVGGADVDGLLAVAFVR